MSPDGTTSGVVELRALLERARSSALSMYDAPENDNTPTRSHAGLAAFHIEQALAAVGRLEEWLRLSGAPTETA